MIGSILGGLWSYGVKLMQGSKEVAYSAYYYSYHYPHTKHLITAIWQNDSKAFHKLLGETKDIEAWGSPKTLLHECIAHSRVEFARLLIQQGADTNAISERKTPLWHALEVGNSEMVALLAKNVTANPYTNYRINLNRGFVHELPFLLKMAVEQQKLSLNQAHQLVHDLACGFYKDTFATYVDLFNEASALSAKINQDYQWRYEQAHRTFTSVIREGMVPEVKIEALKTPQLIIEFPVPLLFQENEYKKMLVNSKVFSAFCSLLDFASSRFQNENNLLKKTIEKARMFLNSWASISPFKQKPKDPKIKLSAEEVRKKAEETKYQIEVCEELLSIIENYATEVKQVFKQKNLDLTVKINIKFDPEVKFEPHVRFNPHTKFSVSFSYPDCDRLRQYDLQHLSSKIGKQIKAKTESVKSPFLDLIETYDDQPLSQEEAFRYFTMEYRAGTEPPLHFACRKNDLKAVTSLLQTGVSVTQSFQDQTPLQIALKHGFIDLAILLIEKKADPNQRIEEMTPLYYAAVNNLPHLAEALLKQRADGKITSNRETALQAALRLGNMAVLKVLKAHEEAFSPVISYTRHFSIFDWHLAIQANDNNILNAVVSLKVDCNQYSTLYGTPLHHAVSRYHVEAIRALLQQGTKRNALHHGKTPFSHLLAELAKCHEEKKELLHQALELFIAHNMHHEKGINPLELLNYCIKHGLNNAIEKLMRENADQLPWNSKEELWFPPLLLAISYGRFEVFKFYNMPEEIQKLQVWCLKNNVPRPLYSAFRQNNLKLCRFLLSVGETVHAIGDERPPLHEAIISGDYKGNLEIVRHLIKSGANVNESFKGITLLQQAISSYEKEIARELILETNTDLKALSPFGDTVLHMAIKRGSGFFEIIRLLISKLSDDDLLICNEDGQSSIDLIMLDPSLKWHIDKAFGETFLNGFLRQRHTLPSEQKQQEIVREMQRIEWVEVPAILSPACEESAEEQDRMDLDMPVEPPLYPSQAFEILDRMDLDSAEPEQTVEILDRMDEDRVEPQQAFEAIEDLDRMDEDKVEPGYAGGIEEDLDRMDLDASVPNDNYLINYASQSVFKQRFGTSFASPNSIYDDFSRYKH